MKALVLAGGKGANMLPLSKDYPKVLLRVAGRAVLDYVLDGIISQGVRDLVVVVSDGRVEEHVLKKWGIYSTVVYQEESGLEGALFSAAEYLERGESFLLAYGDIVAPREFYRLVLSTYSSTGADAVLSTVPVTDVESYGIAVVEDAVVRDVVHEPSKAALGSSYALAGAYVLPYAIIELLERENTLPSALSELVRMVRTASALWTGYWVDVGYPWDVIAASYYVLRELKESRVSSRAKIAPTAVIEGPVVIEEGAVIDHFAVIKGPVYVGKRAFVGMSAFVREYTCIEEGAVVGAFTEVKRSSLQPESSVGSYALVTDSVLGHGAVIEPRVTTMNKLPEEKKVLRELPVQGVVKKLRKLGAFLGPRARVPAGTVLQPLTKVE